MFFDDISADVSGHKHKSDLQWGLHKNMLQNTRSISEKPLGPGLSLDLSIDAIELMNVVECWVLFWSC